MSGLELLFLFPLLFFFSTLLFIFSGFHTHKGKLRYDQMHSGIKLPQGSSGLPIIGETLSFMKPLQVGYLGKFLEEHMSKYGKIFRTNLLYLGKKTVISADPELNRLILLDDGKTFKSFYPKCFTDLMGSSLVAGDNEIYMRLHSIIVNFLNTRQLKTCFLPLIENKVVDFLESWKDLNVFSAEEEANKLSFSVIAEQLMGMDSKMSETEEVRRQFGTFMEGFLSIRLNLPFTAYGKAKQSRSFIVKVIEKKLEERIEKIKDGGVEAEEQDDFVSVMARIDHEFPRERILDFMLTMLFAGHGTVSLAIALVIYFLGGCPKAIQQLREEHLGILKSKRERGEKDEGLNWDDYKKMEFTQCVTNETLRLGPAASFLFRKVEKDVEYKGKLLGCLHVPGYRIPSGWDIILVLSAAHLDPSIYADPQSFNPWRWMDKTTSSNHGIMSFGAGKRMCAGSELAKLEMAVFVHHLVLKYDLEFTEPDHPIYFPHVKFPKGLPIKVKPLL